MNFFMNSHIYEMIHLIQPDSNVSAFFLSQRIENINSNNS